MVVWFTKQKIFEFSPLSMKPNICSVCGTVLTRQVCHIFNLEFGLVALCMRLGMLDFNFSVGYRSRERDILILMFKAWKTYLRYGHV